MKNVQTKYVKYRYTDRNYARSVSIDIFRANNNILTYKSAEWARWTRYPFDGEDVFKERIGKRNNPREKIWEQIMPDLHTTTRSCVANEELPSDIPLPRRNLSSSYFTKGGALVNDLLSEQLDRAQLVRSREETRYWRYTRCSPLLIREYKFRNG